MVVPFKSTHNSGLLVADAPSVTTVEDTLLLHGKVQLININLTGNNKQSSVSDGDSNWRGFFEDEKEEIGEDDPGRCPILATLLAILR